jgi:N-methylhydantoinase A/oxoprolinase/acetone carboxylase beta subunit
MYGAEAAFPEAGTELEALRLFSQLTLPHFPVKKYETVGEVPPEEALKGKRECFWETLGRFAETKIYAWETLRPGNCIEGPAIVEAEATTVVVEPGWTFKIDSFINGVLTYRKS